jgi:hypothetical protein
MPYAVCHAAEAECGGAHRSLQCDFFISVSKCRVCYSRACFSASMRPSKRGSLQSPNPVKHSMIYDPTDVSPINGVPIDSTAASHAVDDCFAILAPVPASSVVDNDASDILNVVASGRGSPPVASVAVVPVPHSSPNSNRDRFLQGFTPARTCCNLDLCRAPAGSKFNLSAICISVFPPSKNPDRRYITLADRTGSVGVTVWNENVAKFGNHAVGQLVSLQKVVIISHHGKKQLSMARDSVVTTECDDKHDVVTWWKSLLLPVPKSCGQVHDITDGSIISISGVVGRVSHEIKMVNGVERTITCVHVVDFSGRLDVKTWNHSPALFTSFVDRPVLIKRVKVSSFAGTKHCELLDGNASIFETSFDGMQELSKFWTT